MITIPTQEFFHPSSLLPSFCLLFSSNHPFPFYFLPSVSSFLLIIRPFPSYLLPSFLLLVSSNHPFHSYFFSFLLLFSSYHSFHFLSTSFLQFPFYFLPSVSSSLLIIPSLPFSILKHSIHYPTSLCTSFFLSFSCQFHLSPFNPFSRAFLEQENKIQNKIHDPT